ncbi:MAG: ribonuclease [Thermomicrobiales bacterium]|nr:ribonuclease [Thermomicrobiales bacterium]MEA2529585.1 ribonuclease [Thermomicrobiales bacterium]MEA2584180.1 ribonuclease [Thermomicrobiales bacterium]MEA2594858.1 ribonuclease [Thermomicrobiales bacterium]
MTIDIPAEIETYRIVFDGGSLGNPGRGYGSFAIKGPGQYAATEKLNYDHLGNRVTNNEAEYLTLIGALEWLANDLGERAKHSRVSVLGDSQLVISQLKGAWKVRKEELKPLHNRASTLLGRFGRFDLTWQPRAESVKVLGH